MDLNKAVSIYNFPQDYPVNYHLNAYMVILNYISQPSYKRYNFLPSKKNLITTMIDKVGTTLTDQQTAEIYDIVETYEPSLIPLIQRRIEQFQPRHIPKNVYHDPQNIHHHKFNNAFNKIAINLYEKYKSVIEIPDREKNSAHKSKCIQTITDIVVPKYLNTELFDKVMNFICTSTAQFTPLNLTLTDILIAVWFWILEQSKTDQPEIFKRVAEEFTEMKGTCSTGHFSRLLNITQGFDKNCTMTETTDFETIVKDYLKFILSKADEVVLDGIIDKNDEFKSYIKKCVTEVEPIWAKTFSDHKKYITIVNKYCDCVIF